MRVGAPLVALVGFAFCAALTGCQVSEADQPLKLTSEERTWLDENPDKLVLYYNTSFPPIEFADEHGAFTGMGADVIKQVEQRLDIRFDMRPCEDWNRHLAALESGECAVAPTIVRTVDRQRFAYFTSPYASVPVVMITHHASHNLRLADLADKRIAVVSGFATEEYLRKHQPAGCEMVVVENVPAGLHAVSFGQVDVFLENLAVAAYYIEQEGTPNLRVGGLTDYTFDWSIGVSRQYQLLYSAIQKAVDSIPDPELRDIRQRWISLTVPSGLTPERLRQYQLIGAFFAALLLSLAVITYFLKRSLNRQVEKLTATQAELAHSEAMFRAIFDNAPFPVILNELETGKYLDANPAYMQLVELDKEELLNSTPLEHSRYVAEDIRNFTRMVQESGTVLDYEMRVNNPDGELGYLNVSAVIMEVNGEKQVLTISKDITKAKRQEEVLRESEFRFHSFFDSNPEGVLLIGVDNSIIDINKSLLQSSGYRIEELRERKFSDFMPQELIPPMLEYIQQIKSGIEQDTPIESAYYHKDGTLVPVSIKAWRLADTTSLPVILGLFVHDLTAEKALESEKESLQAQLLQSQKMEAIGTLAGGIAHDFNNMLFGILGYSDMALAAIDEDAEAAVYLREVITAARRASDLTKKILAFARRSEGQPKPIDLVPVVDEAARLLNSTMLKNIEIKVERRVEQAIVNADASEMHQVLINLCTNARHAMQDKGGVLTLEIGERELDREQAKTDPSLRPGQYFYLSVSDTGSGIQPAVRARIFEPFFTTKKRGEGTGMGLSVVHGIITEIGGAILVDSDVGRGSTFTILLPKSSGAALQVAPETIPDVNGQERIMVVDDEGALAEMLGRMLKRLGYEAAVFQDSRMALEQFKADPQAYDLLLTDLAMPEFTGEQLSIEVLRIRPELPVIICTGFIDEPIERKLAGHGIRHRLMKPLNIKDLARKLREILDQNGKSHE